MIAGACCISPAGYFEPNEDEEGAIKLAEPETLNELFPKASSELKEPDAWVHHEIEVSFVMIMLLFLLCNEINYQLIGGGIIF